MLSWKFGVITDQDLIKKVSEIENMDKVLFSKLNQEEHQTKIAGTHMILAALEQGIGSTWVSYFRVDELSKLLNLPKGYIPAEIIVFGYPKDEMKATKMKSMQIIIVKSEISGTFSQLSWYYIYMFYKKLDKIFLSDILIYIYKLWLIKYKTI